MRLGMCWLLLSFLPCKSFAGSCPMGDYELFRKAPDKVLIRFCDDSGSSQDLTAGQIRKFLEAFKQNGEVVTLVKDVFEIGGTESPLKALKAFKDDQPIEITFNNLEKLNRLGNLYYHFVTKEIPIRTTTKPVQLQQGSDSIFVQCLKAQGQIAMSESKGGSGCLCGKLTMNPLRQTCSKGRLLDRPADQAPSAPSADR